MYLHIFDFTLTVVPFQLSLEDSLPCRLWCHRSLQWIESVECAAFESWASPPYPGESDETLLGWWRFWGPRGASIPGEVLSLLPCGDICDVWNQRNLEKIRFQHPLYVLGRLGLCKGIKGSRPNYVQDIIMTFVGIISWLDCFTVEETPRS